MALAVCRCRCDFVGGGVAWWLRICNVLAAVAAGQAHGARQQVLADAVRAADPAKHVILYESVTWDDFIPVCFCGVGVTWAVWVCWLTRQHAQVGFTKPPGGFNETALAYHYYAPPQFDPVSHFASRAADVARLGGGGMVRPRSPPCCDALLRVVECAYPRACAGSMLARPDHPRLWMRARS